MLWPLFKEKSSPIICALHHDDGQLIPWASSIESFFKVVYARDQNEYLDGNFWFSREELSEELQQYGLDKHFKPSLFEKFLKRSLSIKNVEDILKIDPHSPYALKTLGDRYLKEGRIKEAQQVYLSALDIVPDYGDVMLSLSKVALLLEDQQGSISYLIKAFCAPFYFIENFSEAYDHLRQFKNDSIYDKDDPIWKRRFLIKFDLGEKNPTFHIIINDIIQDYLKLGDYAKAIGLRLSLGALASQDRALKNRYTIAMHEELLPHDLRVAHLESRIPLYGL